MKIPQFIGMLGGIPKKAHYFLGFEKDPSKDLALIYLDPHYVQEAPSLGLSDF